MIYLISILFTLAFVFYTKYQFEDEKASWSSAKGKWHPYGMVMRIALFAAAFTHPKWQDVALSIVICAILFDVGVNVIALNVTPFYAGKTAKSDKMFGKAKWIIYILFLIATVIIKIVL